MFIHAVLLQFRPAADAAFFAEIRKHCDEILVNAEGLHELFFGLNEATRCDGLDHTLIGRFSSRAAHDLYQISAAHQSMKEFMAPLIERIVVVDAEIREREVQ